MLLCLCAIVPPCLAPEKTETAKQVPARFGKLVELRLNIHGLRWVSTNLRMTIWLQTARRNTTQHNTAQHCTSQHITLHLAWDILDQGLQGWRARRRHHTQDAANDKGVDVAISPRTGGSWIVAGGVRLRHLHRGRIWSQGASQIVFVSQSCLSPPPFSGGIQAGLFLSSFDGVRGGQGRARRKGSRTRER